MPGGNAPSPDGVVVLDDSVLMRGVFLLEGWQARAGIGAGLDAALERDGWRPVDIRRPFRRQGFPDRGSVSYRLRLRLPPDWLARGWQVRGALQYANNAYRIWAVLPDGSRRLLAESGTPSDTLENVALQRLPLTFTLPAAPEMTLVWQVSNRAYAHGGPFHPFFVGSNVALQRTVLRHVVSAVLVAGFFVAIALCSLLLWLQDGRDPVPPALLVLGLLAALRTVTQSGLLEWLQPHTFGFESRMALEMATRLLLPAGTAFLLLAAMPWMFAPLRLPGGRVLALPPDPFGVDARLVQPPLWLRRTATGGVVAMAVSTLVLGLAALLAPGAARGVLFEAALVNVALLLALLVLAAALVLQARHPCRWLFAGAFLSVAVAGAHDLLVNNGLWVPRQYWLSYGYFAFFVLFGVGFVLLKLRAKHAAEAANGVLVAQLEARSRELQVASQAAQAAYLARSQFLTAVSHELRTPLAAIMGYAQLLRDEWGHQMPPPSDEFLGAITASSERLLHLIDDLLDLSRIEAGRFSVRPAPADAAAIARDVYTQLYPLAYEKDLTLAVDVAPGVAALPFVTDGARLRQVLVNLVSNAIKFTETGEVKLEVAPEAPAHLCFRVVDTGIGIAPAFQPQLFERFTQEPGAYHQVQRGTGLGLYLSREMVTRMGGEIRMDSVPGQGSTFSVLLPLRPPDA